MNQPMTEAAAPAARLLTAPSLGITTVQLRQEHDVVLARQRAREIAGHLGFEAQDQTRIATAVSELARNALIYAGGGEVEFRLEGRTPPQLFLVRIGDHGPGIANLPEILAGGYRSSTGMGLGIAGARRLVDQCQIRTEAGRGTLIELKKLLPAQAPLATNATVRGVLDFLARQRLRNPLEELQQQNHELVRALAELRQRQEELEAINRELEDTNRGVVALYAELDEKADHLRRADELKTRFLSDMSHEFRTPLNSILALSSLLLEGADGPLNGEQEKQVSYIRKSGENLLELVNDLLDLAKIEAGKIEVRPSEFSAANLFSALRGMLRPLLVNQRVQLVFAEPDGVPLLESDEGKVSQILRNFISNALKFTERGEVRVAAAYDESAKSVTFSVTDTGIGIAPEDQQRIFQDFVQLDNQAQRKYRGTGLGLPLCRKLAELLGGRIALQSELGVGSKFSVTIPLRHRPAGAAPLSEEPAVDALREGLPVLVVEDEPQVRLLYEKYLRRTAYRLVPAGSVRQAHAALRREPPAAIILDILLRGEDTWNFLAESKANDATRHIPVIVVSTVDDRHKALALGADAYFSKPVERAQLLAALAQWLPAPAELRGPGEAAPTAPALSAPELSAPESGPLAAASAAPPRVLIIENEPVFRYIVRRYLEHHPCSVDEAADGAAGLAAARQHQPELILLDLGLPDIAGTELLRRLKAEPATRAIPVVIVTAGDVSAPEREQMSAAVAVLNKRDLDVERAGQLLRHARSA